MIRKVEVFLLALQIALAKRWLMMAAQRAQLPLVLLMVVPRPEAKPLCRVSTSCSARSVMLAKSAIKRAADAGVIVKNGDGLYERA